MPCGNLQLRRYQEIILLVVIIAMVCLLSSLPLVIYFAQSSVSSSSLELHHQNNSLTTLIDQNAIANDSTTLFCTEDFFINDVGDCNPSCSSWTMHSKPVEKAALVIVGISQVIGILSTIVIIILSFTSFKIMLEFPIVLVIYQDVIISVHGVNILIGLADKRLFCTSDDLLETFNSPASPYCTFSGIVSSHLGLPLTIWISIQVGFTLLAVYAPVHFKQLKESKWKWHSLHIASLVAGIASALFPAMLTLGVVGYSSLDTKFPPIVCYAAGYRSIAIYVFLLPTGVLNAVLISELILLFHFLLRKRCTMKANKDFKAAEVKVALYCAACILIGIGVTVSYGVVSSPLRQIDVQLMQYFECERVPLNYRSGTECDRSGFERLTHPAGHIILFSLVALYPMATLVFFYKKRSSDTKQVTTNKHSPSSNGETCTTSSRIDLA